MQTKARLLNVVERRGPPNTRSDTTQHDKYSLVEEMLATMVGDLWGGRDSAQSRGSKYVQNEWERGREEDRGGDAQRAAMRLRSVVVVCRRITRHNPGVCLSVFGSSCTFPRAFTLTFLSSRFLLQRCRNT